MKNSINLFLRVIKNIYTNKYTYFANAALLELFLLTVGAFSISLIFKLILLVTGQSNLSYSNFWIIATNPYAIVLMFIMFIVFSFFVLLEYALLTMLIFSKIRDTHFSLRTILKTTLKKLFNILKGQHIFYIVYFILIFPFANLGISSVLLGEIYIPKFITEEIVKTNVGLGFYLLTMIVLAFINLRLVFLLPLMIISDKSFIKNLRYSFYFSEWRRLSWLVAIVLLEFVLLLIAVLVLIIIVPIITYINPSGDNIYIQAIFYTLISGILFFLSITSKMVFLTTIVTVIADKRVVNQEIYDHKKEEKKKSKLLWLLIGVTMISSLFYNANKLSGAVYNDKVEVIAHRGFILNAVENSLESLEEAVNKGADYIETDIILTKDNQFVVSHDNNLKRLTGLDKNVREMTSNEVVGLSIYQNGYRSQLVSLDDFIDKAKSLNTKLLIEIKLYGNEPENLHQLLITQLEKHKVLYDYKLMSLNLDVMKKIENADHKIETGYVLPLLFGSFIDEDLDFYLVEDFSYNFYFANKSRLADKEIYVWTINDRDRIENYLQTTIDGIITDKLEEVNDIKKDLSEHTSYLDRLIRLVINKL